jgi:hypothetical protein
LYTPEKGGLTEPAHRIVQAASAAAVFPCNDLASRYVLMQRTAVAGRRVIFEMRLRPSTFRLGVWGRLSRVE